MGSPETEPGRDSDETQHQITLTQDFQMMKTEVTQKMWIDVMQSNPSYFKGDDLPAERVSWNEVQDFIRRLNILRKLDFLIWALLPFNPWRRVGRAKQPDAAASKSITLQK